MMLNTPFSRLLFGTGAATVVGLLTAYAPAKPVTPTSAEPATVATFTQENPPDVPPEIQVPAGNKLFLKVHAVGTQNYTCTGAGTWGPAVPAANLFNKHGMLVGTHFGGPTWQYMDGSSVLGVKVAGVFVPPPPAPAVAIQWLLVQKVSTTTGPDGGDRLTGTTYIQRINTTGGLAPAGACVSGTTASIPYTADYYFYRAATGDDDGDDD
jgi:hypothetical protein